MKSSIVGTARAIDAAYDAKSARACAVSGVVRWLRWYTVRIRRMPSSCAAAAAFWRTVNSSPDTSRWPGDHTDVIRTASKPASAARSICVFATTGSMLRAWSSAAPTNMTVPASAAGATRSERTARRRRRRRFMWGLSYVAETRSPAAPRRYPRRRSLGIPLTKTFGSCSNFLRRPSSAGELEPLGEPRVLGRSGVEPRQRVGPAAVRGVVAADAVVDDTEVREHLPLRPHVAEPAQDLERSLEGRHRGVGVDVRLREAERAQRQRLAPVVTGLAIDVDRATMG